MNKITRYRVSGCWTIGKYKTLREARIERIKECKERKLKLSTFHIVRETIERVA
jgi:hypothetical protein